MSIERLMKVSMVGLIAEKREMLETLQRLGTLHIIPLRNANTAEAIDAHGRDALQFLVSSPQKFRQVVSDKHFDAERIEREALQLRQRMDRLTAKRDQLKTLIDQRRPWGDFRPPSAGDLLDQQLWLYRLPEYQRALIENSGLPWELVAHDNQFHYFAVLSKKQPASDVIPLSPVLQDPRSLGELEIDLEDLDLAIDDAQVQRTSLSRWCLLLNRSIAHLDDKAAVDVAESQTRDSQPLFALEAWIPEENVPQLESFAQDRAIALNIRPPEPTETPPTRFRNPKIVAGGEDLVTFYMTPSYWLSDPSPFVFVAFGLFFAMIMSDAGYGIILAMLTAAFWRRLGGSGSGRRWRYLLTWITGLTIVYGIAAGSYFGVAPRSGLLKSLHILDTRNYAQMMVFSAIVGVTHLTIANLMNVWRYRGDARLLAPIGWIFMIDGGMALAIATKLHSEIGRTIGVGALVCGLLLVVVFTAAGEKPGKRMLLGMLGLTKITSAFGDVLSYLRLFALGLASASLATVFNGIARGMYHKLAGLGLLVAIVVLLFGHTVNLFLGVSSGFIHGLRLNVIEFFNWGVQEEGKAFRPFERKENVTWKS